MTITPEIPVTAHDLAEALREAVDLLNTSYLEAWSDDHQHVDRWQSLLDRHDAQVRESYEADIAHAIGMRDAWMARSHRTRDKGFDVDTIRGDVDDARACNWHALRLRRELRAIGGEA